MAQQRLIPQIPCSGFNTQTAIPRHFNTFHTKRDIQCPANFSAKFGPGICIWAQAVMDVHGLQIEIQISTQPCK
jgi:hypothetical protein